MKPFRDEFRLFSHLGFTHTTYITVKRKFLIFIIFRLVRYFHFKKRLKIKIGLRYIYERVYNNDVFGKSNTLVV